MEKPNQNRTPVPSLDSVTRGLIEPVEKLIEGLQLRGLQGAHDLLDERLLIGHGLAPCRLLVNYLGGVVNDVAP